MVYQGNSVYHNGNSVATQEQYAEQAAAIADAGSATADAQDEEWLALGVFAMIQGQQMNGNDVFQLAINKSGIIRGNYYNSLIDSTLPVYGSVDKKTQRAAWKIVGRNKPVFEVGFANLTQSETTMLVHFDKDHTQQWTLVRIGKPAEPK